MSALRPRAIFLIPFVFLLGIFCARLPTTIAQFVGGGPDFFSPIADVRQFLESTYVEEPDMEKLRDGAIAGMLEALDDPYAQYIPPKEADDFAKELLGRFCGIGAQIQVEAGYPTVVTPLEDSPAFRAGILAGDKIIEIEGQSTLGLTVDDCVTKLAGEPDTKVSLKIRREEQVLDFTLVRQEIVLRAVQGVNRLPDGQWNFMIDDDAKIAYVRLAQFIPTAPDELARALDSVGAPSGKLRGLILDLRHNPGGDLESCLDIADMFLKQGTILSVRGRPGDEESYEANGPGTLPDFPITVLINGFSASASEILAGSLADHNRAVVVGSRSFGKGLVQAVRALPHLPKAQVKYTIQRYYLPSGRLIQRTDDSSNWGVDPTPGFYVPMTDEQEIASQIKRRELDVLRTGVRPSESAAPRWADPTWIETELQDTQLAGALRAMETRLASGAFTPLNDVTQQVSAVNMEEVRTLEKSHQRILRALLQVERRMEALDTALSGSKLTSHEPDFWPDDLNLTGGAVKILAPDGKLVADLRITGRELERWLALADVQAATPPAPAPAPDDAKNEAPDAKTPDSPDRRD